MYRTQLFAVMMTALSLIATAGTAQAQIVLQPDGAGDPSSPIRDSVLSTVFFIFEDATSGECEISIDGDPLDETGAIDNVFSIVRPLAAPIDGGVGDADDEEDGVITVASTDRSDGGAVTGNATESGGGNGAT